MSGSYWSEYKETDGRLKCSLSEGGGLIIRSGRSFLKDGQQIVKCFAGDDPAVEESDDVAGDAGGDERSFAYALDALAEEEGEDCGQGD